MSSKPSTGSYWKHAVRGSIAIVLCVEEDAVTFQFPAARNNPARGTGRWPLARFLRAFTLMPSLPPGQGL